MSTRTKSRGRVLVIAAAIALVARSAAVAAAQVQVVDMIPQQMSDETRINGEPYLAVNPANPLILAATAFMPTPMASPNGPLLVSFDGGTTWIARNVIPSAPDAFFNTGDVTIHFNGAGTALYGGILLTESNWLLEVIRTTDMTFNTPMDVLNTPRPSDQPYVYARTVTGWFDAGVDRVWVGNDEIAAAPTSATVDQSLDAGIAMPVFSQIRIDADTPVGRDNYQVRTVAHPDGHVYAAFYRRQGDTQDGYNADVVVVRDDDWGKPMKPFTSLVDSMTMVAGENVVAATPVSDTMGSDPSLGNEWWGGDLYLTVDPNDSANVYLSYSDSQNGTDRTLHLRKSTDYGQTWLPDLLTTPSAKNAAIAINSHGRIGYLYQSFVPHNYFNHWETHLRRSPDGIAWDDVILADFPAEGPGAFVGDRIVGDYMNLVAVGKNFYGVFSSDNDLVNASFPAGVTFLRNRTPVNDPMPRLLGMDGMTTVDPSIDPFFFRTTEIDPVADFYVRDWTDDANTHDHGQEPSVRSVFFATSDVWTCRSNDPQPFDGNDRPQAQDPQPMAMGPNFAFARISREATGAAADVTLSYLYSDGGVGVPFVSAGASTTLHLDAADAAQTPLAGAGYSWNLPSGMSNHVCVAVEISTNADPILAPSLLGHAPGWPTTDLMVVADNNKAQRNLQVFGFGGMGQGGDGGGGNGGGEGGPSMSMYAIAHNAATHTRDLRIGIAVDPKSLRLLSKASVRIVGARPGEPRPVKNGDVVTLPAMEPGENRWIEFSFTPAAGTPAAGTPAAGAREPVAVDLLELVNDLPVNGYSLVPTAMEPERAIGETLLQHACVFTRLDAAFGVAGASRQAALARELARNPKVPAERYASFLAAESKAIAAIVALFLKSAGMHDLLDLTGQAKALDSAARDAKAAQPIHLTLLNKLDAMQTMRQKADGDAADVPQEVRWQQEVFTRAKDLRGRARVVESSARYLADFDQRKVGVDGFLPLEASLQAELQEAAAKDRSGEAARRLERLLAATAPNAAQLAHREFMLAIEAAGGR